MEKLYQKGKESGVFFAAVRAKVAAFVPDGSFAFGSCAEHIFVHIFPDAPFHLFAVDHKDGGRFVEFITAFCKELKTNAIIDAFFKNIVVCQMYGYVAAFFILEQISVCILWKIIDAT